MERIYKTGDKLFDYMCGWMVVIGEDDIYVRLEDAKHNIHYFFKETNKTLSFTEYTLKGFTQERPLFNIGDMGYFWDTDVSDRAIYGKLTELDKNGHYPYIITNCLRYKHFSLTPPDLKY